MYNKIICPTDFSPASDNAINYAAKLAQIFWAELLLLNIQKISPITFSATFDINPGSNSEEKIKHAAAGLRSISEHLNKAFHISSTYEIEISSKSITKAIAAEGDKKVLFVIGSNGEDNVYKRIFGSNSFRLAQETKLPVLVIPESAEYRTVKKVLFVITKEDQSILPLEELQYFLEKFDARITFLVTGNINTYENCRAQAEKFYKEKISEINFWNKNSNDPMKTMEEISETSEFDLYVIQQHEKSLIQKLLVRDLLKNIISKPKIPVLILHELFELK